MGAMATSSRPCGTVASGVRSGGCCSRFVLRGVLAATALAPAAGGAAAAGLGYHGALGISEHASADEVRVAFLARGGTGADTAPEVREAFGVLSDPDKRRRHEELVAAVRRELGGSGAADAAGRQANLARGRPTAQSSTRPGGGESSRAVDGLAEPRWAKESCTHTAPQGEVRPWWSVDLGRAQPVGRVRLLNRLEASERLRNWQVRVGQKAEPWTAVPCGPEQEGPAGPGAWEEADCGGRHGRWVSVVLGSARTDAILTLCEVEVFEPSSARAGESTATGRAAAARRLVAEFFAVRASPWQEDRPLYLSWAAELLRETLAGLGGGDTAGLQRLQQELLALRGPGGEAARAPALFALHSELLERLAFGEGCRRQQRCCEASLTGSALGCLSLAMALAKRAGELGRASELYERGVTPDVGAGLAGRPPLAQWTSFWQTCELFLPQLGNGAAVFSPFWDPQEPALQALTALLQESVAALRLDLRQVLAGGGEAFVPAFASIVEEGGWERLVLYNGQRGWDPQWCGPRAARPLHLCGLLAKQLPGEAAGLVEHYLLEDNEEVSISRFLPPRTRLAVHNGGTNARINLDIGLLGTAGASIRVGGRLERLGEASGHVLAYDACYDREVLHEGSEPLYVLQVGIMHPSMVEELRRRRSQGEL